MQGDLGTLPMSNWGVRSPGHEGAGVVVKVGCNVKNFKLGDRAGIKPILDTCGSCALCWHDKETYCKDAVHTGLMATGQSDIRACRSLCAGRADHTRDVSTVHCVAGAIRVAHSRRDP